MKRALLFALLLAAISVAGVSAYHTSSSAYYRNYYQEPIYSHTVVMGDGYNTYYNYDRQYVNGYTRGWGYTDNYRGGCIGSGCGRAHYISHGRPYGHYYPHGHYCWSYPHSCGGKYNRWYW